MTVFTMRLKSGKLKKGYIMMKLITLLVMFMSLVFAVDINNADAESLQDLYGVGPKKADAIIRYRNANGCFSKVEDITKVKGIGPKTLKKNRAEIVVGKCGN